MLLCLSVCLVMYPPASPISPPPIVHLSACLSTSIRCLPASVCLPTEPSASSYLSLSMSVSIDRQFLCLPVCVSVGLAACLPICLVNHLRSLSIPIIVSHRHCFVKLLGFFSDICSKWWRTLPGVRHNYSRHCLYLWLANETTKLVE